MTEAAPAEIDAHILIGDEQEAWRALCMSDVQAISVNLREPGQSMPAIELNLHTLPAVAGHFGSARRAGFGAGQAPYVTFFDPDDRYPWDEASAFLRDAVRVLESEPEVLLCYSLERRIDERGYICSFINRPAQTLEEALAHSAAMHGLQLWRRGAAQQALSSIPPAEQRLELAMRRAALSNISQARCIALVARHWRLHPEQHSMSHQTHAVSRPA